MKFPKHIILDLNKPEISNSSQYWAITYLALNSNYDTSFNDIFFHRKFFLRKQNLLLNKIIKNQKKFTLKYSLINEAVFLDTRQKKFIKFFFSTNVKIKNPLHLSNHKGKNILNYMNSSSLYDIQSIKRLFKNFQYTTQVNIFKYSSLWKFFDIYFLKKEKIYTKLKYSRVPQYDIVSGGVAAFFAAFLGFLITEKFGFELLDSGDFYYLFIYMVFIFFIIRLFLNLINDKLLDWGILSYKWILNFYKVLFFVFIKFFNIFKKK